jgi:hypothetical protein
VYTHFFLDTKKSDFAIMIVHHVVTLSLLYGAYVVGYLHHSLLSHLAMTAASGQCTDARTTTTVGCKQLLPGRHAGDVQHGRVRHFPLLG